MVKAHISLAGGLGAISRRESATPIPPTRAATPTPIANARLSRSIQTVNFADTNGQSRRGKVARYRALTDMDLRARPDPTTKAPAWECWDGHIRIIFPEAVQRG